MAKGTLQPHDNSPYPSQQSHSRGVLKANELFFGFFLNIPEDVKAVISSKLTGAPGFLFLMLTDFRNTSDVLIAHGRNHPLAH